MDYSGRDDRRNDRRRTLVCPPHRKRSGRTRHRLFPRRTNCPKMLARGSRPAQGTLPYRRHDGMVECRKPAQPDVRLCVCCGGRVEPVNDDVNLIPSQLRARLLDNGVRTASDEDYDPQPVVRLYVPGSLASWLLTELDPDDHDLAYGLCDVGLGSPKLDYVRLSDLIEIIGDELQLDTAFEARQSLSAYLEEARKNNVIVP